MTPAMNAASTAKPLQSIDHVREQFHNLHEFVAVARAKLDRNVWDYLIGGAETETTVRRNRLALDSLAFRPRVLRDVNGTDTSTKFLGRKTELEYALPVAALSRLRVPQESVGQQTDGAPQATAVNAARRALASWRSRPP